MAATAAATTAGGAEPAAAPTAAGRSGNSDGFGDLPRWLAERLFEGAKDNAGGRPTQALVLEDRCVHVRAPALPATFCLLPAYSLTHYSGIPLPAAYSHMLRCLLLA
jgi:hypothetical protein